MKKILVFLFSIIMVLTGCTPTTSTSAKDVDKTKVIFDAPKYCKIGVDQLIDNMGKTEDVEKWKNKSAKGTFKMTIYSYDKNSLHYEFLVADDTKKVVRVNIYSSKNWNGKGENIKYSTKSMNEFLALFNINEASDAKVLSDTGVAYRISPVSPEVGDIWIQGLDDSSSSFESAKITYDLNYFE